MQWQGLGLNQSSRQWPKECELLWLKIILDDLRIKQEGPMKLYCDNKLGINIAHNPVQHKRTKHIEIDRHFIKKKLEGGMICMPYMP